MNSVELLATYHRDGCEDAFRELVRRHTGFVFSVARRRLADTALAEDVVQAVFTRLARGSPRFSREAEVMAWLHRTTLHVAIDVWRSETRRRRRETTATSMNTTTSAPDECCWEEIAPDLDQALNDLPRNDREALLLRFFQGRPMLEIGGLLGISEDAAKMRVSRAVDRLRGGLAQRGLACSAGVLVTYLGDRQAEAVPAGLAVRLMAALPASPIPISAGLGIFHRLGNVGLHQGLAVGGLLLVPIVAWWLMAVRVGTQADPTPNHDATSVAARPIAAATRSARGTFRRAPLPVSAESRPVRMSVTVVNRMTGAAIAGARVDAPTFFAGGESEPQSVVTGSDGRADIRFTRREEADHGINVFVTAEGFVPLVLPCSAEAARGEHVVRLEGATAVTGRVVDEAGAPVAEAKVRIDANEGSGGEGRAFHHVAASVVSDGEGRWTSPFVPRDFESVSLEVSHPEYAVTLAEVPVASPSGSPAPLVLRRGFAVAGRVTDEAGSPLAGAIVCEYHNSGYPRKSAQSGQDGRYCLSGLGMTWAREGIVSEPPRALLVAEAAGYAPSKQTVELKEPTTNLDIRLGNGWVLHGRVVDDWGRPLSGAVVRADSDNDGLRPYAWSTHTDSIGRFEWPNAPSEPVLFWFEADGFPARRHVLLEPGEDAQEIRLRRSGATE